MTDSPQEIEIEDTAPDRDLPEQYCSLCDASYAPEARHCPKDGTKLVRIARRKDPLIGRTLDQRFTIQSKLGAGGMGAVYRALQHSVGREVAIKVIDPRLAAEVEITKRFLRETRLTSRLSHPNTVTVLDFGQTEDGLLYLVMELLAGKSLDSVIETEGALPEERCIRIGMQICDALNAAEDLQIVHRDLKPANIVVLESAAGRDFVKVLDFGIAKSIASDSIETAVTRSDVILGTPSYMAPEAISGGGQVDHRADLYSLGIMLYEMTTGRLPFGATTVESMLRAHLFGEPNAMPKHVHPALRAITERLMARSADQRFQNAASARAALAAALEDSSTVVKKSQRPPPVDPMASTTPGDGLTLPVAEATSASAGAVVTARVGTADSTPQRRGTRRMATVAATASVIALSIALLSRGADSPEIVHPTVAKPAIAVAHQPSDASPSPSDNRISDANSGSLASTPASNTQITFDLRSRPRGAQVVLHIPGIPTEVVCEGTPCRGIKRPKVAANGTLVFSRDGYADAVVRRVDLQSDRIDETRRLRKKRTRPRKQTKDIVDGEPPSDEEFIRR